MPDERPYSIQQEPRPLPESNIAPPTKPFDPKGLWKAIDRANQAPPVQTRRLPQTPPVNRTPFSDEEMFGPVPPDVVNRQQDTNEPDK